MAVVMLMVAALMMGDEQAFESHAKGVSSLLVHRSRHPERAGRYIKPQWYTFSPSVAYQDLSFSGTGIRRLAKQGFISQAAWSAYFKEAMTLSTLILLTPGDTFWRVGPLIITCTMHKRANVRQTGSAPWLSISG